MLILPLVMCPKADFLCIIDVSLRTLTANKNSKVNLEIVYEPCYRLQIS